MILPNKYISPSNSFIGESAKLLSVLGKKRMTIDKLWLKLETCVYNKGISFTKFLQVITFMYACGIVTYDEDTGVLYNENLQPKDI